MNTICLYFFLHIMNVQFVTLCIVYSAHKMCTNKLYIQRETIFVKWTVPFDCKSIYLSTEINEKPREKFATLPR